MAYGAETTNLTNYNNWLKNQYYGPFKGMLVTFNTSCFWFDPRQGFKRKMETQVDGGGGFIYPLQTSRLASFRSGAEGQTLAPAKSSDKQRINGTMRFHNSRYEFEGLTAARTRQDKFSYEDASKEMMDLADHFARFMDDAMWRDGSGVLARINDATPAGALAVGLDANMATGGSETFGGDHLHAGMDIAVWDGTQPKNTVADPFVAGDNRGADGEREVASVDSETQMSLTTSVFGGTVADNDWMTWSVDRPNSQIPSEITGMLAHINNTGTVHGIDKNANTWFRSYVTGTSGAGTAFNIEDVDTHLRNIVHRVGDNRQRKIYLVCRPAMASRIWRETLDNTRYRAEDLGKQAGFSSFAFTRFKTKVEVIEAVNGPAGSLWYIVPDSFVIHQSFEPQFLDQLFDAPRLRSITDRWAYGTPYGWDCECVCVNPAYNGVAKGYAE